MNPNAGGANNEGKPLMRIIRRAMDRNGKVTMYEPEVLDILRDELAVETAVLDPDQLFICSSVVATAFRKWNGWPKFAKRVYEIKTIENEAILSQILDIRYNNLKKYLQHKLDSSDFSELAAISHLHLPEMLKRQFEHTDPLISNLENVTSIGGVPINNRTLNSKSRKRIFSLPDDQPFCVTIPPNLLNLTMSEVSLSTILNWGCFVLHVNLSALMMRRQPSHAFVQSYVSSLIEDDSPDASEPPLQVNRDFPDPSVVSKRFLCNLLKKMMTKAEESPHVNVMKMIFFNINRDFLKAPHHVKVPSSYVIKMGVHPYNRCFHKDVFRNTPFFERDYLDCHKHQTVYPRYQLEVTHVEDTPLALAAMNEEFFRSVHVECRECRVSYDGVNMLTDLQRHFVACHNYGGDWQCPHCSEWAPMTTLADNRWIHVCSAKPQRGDPVKIKCRAKKRRLQ